MKRKEQNQIEIMGWDNYKFMEVAKLFFLACN